MCRPAPGNEPAVRAAGALRIMDLAVIIKPVGPLCGRDSECAVLARLVASTAGGAGGSVVVEGAAGIGKSRLLAEAGHMAAAGVFRWLPGVRRAGPVTPWAPLLRALSSTSPMLVSEADLAPCGRLLTSVWR